MDPKTSSGPTYLHLNQLTCNDQTHPRPPLLPHRPRYLVLSRFSCFASALSQQSMQTIQVPHVVACPVLDPRLHDLELEGEDAVKEPLPRSGRRHAVEHREEIRDLGGCLVIQPQAG